jgi:hypothetical protein
MYLKEASGSFLKKSHPRAAKPKTFFTVGAGQAASAFDDLFSG